jgi:glycosyltransferase involved in cell wall biosynthesis
MIILSIIIPCYNSEKYIIRALNSIKVFEDFKNNFEIIIVNDGSTDSTVDLSIDFFKNNNFTYIIKNQLNLGLSEARNNGLKIANGKYIWFVDSDDEVVCEETEALFKILEEQIDLIYFPILSKTIQVEKINNDFKSNHRIIGAQFYIYNRLFLLNNDLFFVPKLIHEDLEFLPRVFNRQKSTYNFKSPLYKHIYTQNSITSSAVKFIRVKSLIDIAILHCKQYKSGNLKYFGFYSLVSINSALSLCRKLKSQDFKLFTEYVRANIKSINLILIIKSFSITKIKSFLTILIFNFLSINNHE